MCVCVCVRESQELTYSLSLTPPQHNTHTKKSKNQTLEIARLLRAKGHPLPHHLILSGCPPSDVRTVPFD